MKSRLLVMISMNWSNCKHSSAQFSIFQIVHVAVCPVRDEEKRVFILAKQQKQNKKTPAFQFWHRLFKSVFPEGSASREKHISIHESSKLDDGESGHGKISATEGEKLQPRLWLMEPSSQTLNLEVDLCPLGPANRNQHCTHKPCRRPGT